MKEFEIEVLGLKWNSYVVYRKSIEQFTEILKGYAKNNKIDKLPTEAKIKEAYDKIGAYYQKIKNIKNK